MALAARSASNGPLAGKSAGRRALPVLRQPPVSLLCAVDSAAAKRAAFHEASNSAVFKAKTSGLSAADLLMLLSPTVATSANIGGGSGGPYACRECSNKFPSLHSLDFHHQTYHTNDKKSRPPPVQVGGGCSSGAGANSGSCKSGTASPAGAAKTGLQDESAKSRASDAAAASQSLRSLSPSPSATTAPSSGPGDAAGAGGAIAAIAAKSSSSSQQRRGAKRVRSENQPVAVGESQASKRGGKRGAPAAPFEAPQKKETDVAIESANCRVQEIAPRLTRVAVAKKWTPPSVLITNGADKVAPGDFAVRDGGAVTPSDTSALPRRISAFTPRGTCGLGLADRMNSLTSSLTDLTAAGSNPVSPTTPTNIGFVGGATPNGSFFNHLGGGKAYGSQGDVQASQVQQLIALVMQDQEKYRRLRSHQVPQQQQQQQQQHRQQQQQRVTAAAPQNPKRAAAQYAPISVVSQPQWSAQWTQPASVTVPMSHAVTTTVTPASAAAAAADLSFFSAAAGGRPAVAHGSDDVAGGQLSMLVAVLASRLGQQKSPAAAGAQVGTSPSTPLSPLSAAAPAAAGGQEVQLLNNVQGLGMSIGSGGSVTAVAAYRGLDLDLRL